MRTKTNELSGIALDYAVAVCEGLKITRFDGGVLRYEDSSSYIMNDDVTVPSYHMDWKAAGGIIERENISIAAPSEILDFCYWSAMTDFSRHKQDGQTALVAAMRCYVASKSGNTVEIPDILLGE